MTAFRYFRSPPATTSRLAALSLAALSVAAGAGLPSRPMIEIRSGNTLLEGTVLASDGSRVEFLARDGRLWDLAAGSLAGSRPLPMSFRSASATEVRAALERELDGQLSVGGTSHFVVACPQGQVARWSQRFEDLLRSFRHYFAVRGLEPHEPEFPLIAVVWPSQQEFLRQANREGNKVGPGVLGFYSPLTNRVSLYDSAALRGGDWGQNASVIIHEATHQSAFNTGLHNRFAPPPRWLAEGLGMLFEARGVYDSVNYPSFEDRVNRGRLAQFRKTQASGRSAGAWVELIGSDRMFEHDISAAYAESWAFSFFLSETQPARYDQFLARTAARADFQPYPQAARVADFKAVFGDNFPMLEADFLRFISAIR